MPQSKKWSLIFIICEIQKLNKVDISEKSYLFVSVWLIHAQKTNYHNFTLLSIISNLASQTVDLLAQNFPSIPLINVSV